MLKTRQTHFIRQAKATANYILRPHYQTSTVRHCVQERMFPWQHLLIASVCIPPFLCVFQEELDQSNMAPALDSKMDPVVLAQRMGVTVELVDCSRTQREEKNTDGVQPETRKDSLTDSHTHTHTHTHRGHRYIQKPKQMHKQTQRRSTNAPV